ncbi:ABC transporter ATP-binding protein [Methylomonas paludis]|uniref:ABC transporter ATP-binding protein n=1 Tax=Methylomonas paludis TaxID=1173101 RepID=A0A975MQN4_9GAMM|nr:ATP-binding cassette domain-containing protein [Methylomonas paludis]QWF72268.1 ABC transporter ATP-binding protein [Methylomonas paludis]
MNSQPAAIIPWLVSAEHTRKTFINSGELVVALDSISVQIAAGTLTALVGPDGAGKTTLLRLVCGLLPADSGHLQVLGVDVSQDPQNVQSRIGYMPQRFGLYDDLTVRENLNLYADLHGVALDQRQQRYAQLLEMTDLGKFIDRLAGQLSGGMKQKLGLACTLVRSPELLVLDEPTVGVDPLSRRELWRIIQQLVKQEGLTVLISTAYLDEAEHCDQAIVLDQGRVLSQGLPQTLSQTATGKVFMLQPATGQLPRNLQMTLLDDPAVADALPSGGLVRVVLRELPANAADPALAGSNPASSVPAHFEDGFMLLLRQNPDNVPAAAPTMQVSTAHPGTSGETIIEVRDLVRRFGTFTAVDKVSFEVKRGEIFGLLGPNGAGKTTTFRMLCGLLAPSSGTLRVIGQDMRFARASARQRIGYVAQKFALYSELTVSENLEFFAGAYGLRGQRRHDRLDWAISQFELGAMLHTPSGRLPGGYRQRLAMAAALMHEPEVLFLDEPTSGADPQARREFWRRITALAAQGVTIVITTHFMEEAEYCDRALIQDAGRLLAQGTPAQIRSLGSRADGGSPTMEDAFISIVESSRRHAA